ncbi:MAG: hypothetical protein H7333_02800 [Bdellovibrionales bacterium]|nr:hypothetical protein [Oligoflexia bacterium]
MSVVGSKSAEATKRKSLSILIIQLGETDELFRSLMALKAVKHLYPEMKFTMIARHGVSAPLKRVAWIENVIETPKLVKGGDPVTQVATWIDHVINQNYDILANWTFAKAHTRLSAIATTLIPAMIKVGDHLRNDMTQGSYDAWSIYREAWLRDENIDQDIHITDIITTQLLTLLQIHAGDPDPEAGSATVTSKYFFEQAVLNLPQSWLTRPKGLKWIALHAASLSNRSAEWVEMVLRRNPDFGIVALGTFEDAAVNPRVITLEKELHFDSLVAILSQCSWLAAGKHPIVDLASLLNVRIFYGVNPSDREYSLKWTETGPYGNGHVVMAPKDEWKPELAYAAWSYYQSEWFHKNTLTLHGHFENLGLVSGLDELQVFKSRIRSASEGGGVYYERSAGVAREFEQWMYRVRGQMARAWFCGWLPCVETEVAKLSLNPELIKRIRSVNDSVLLLEKLAQEGRQCALDLHKTAQKNKAGYLMSVEERDEIEHRGKKILEVESLIARVISVEPELRCLLKWYQQLMHNLQGETLAAMAKETVHGFDLIAEGVDLLLIYTRKTLELAKPKSVAGPKPMLTLPN